MNVWNYDMVITFIINFMWPETVAAEKAKTLSLPQDPWVVLWKKLSGYECSLLPGTAQKIMRTETIDGLRPPKTKTNALEEKDHLRNKTT